jgi:hypothetical protein
VRLELNYGGLIGNRVGLNVDTKVNAKIKENCDIQRNI